MAKLLLTADTLNVDAMLARTDAATIRRGMAYSQQGRVRLARVERDEAEARVTGTQVYQVHFGVDQGGVYSFCDCPLSNGDPDIVCKHQIAAAVILRNYLRVHPPQTWENVLAQAVRAEPKHAAPAARQVLFFSLQARHSQWAVYPYSLPLSHFAEAMLGDADALAKTIKQEALSRQAKPLRAQSDPRRFVSASGGDATLNLAALAGQSYSPYYERSFECRALLPLLAGGFLFRGRETDPLQTLVRVSDAQGKAQVELNQTPEGTALLPSMTLGDRKFALTPEKTAVVSSDPLWLLSGNTLYPVEDGAALVTTLLDNPDLLVPPDDTQAFLDTYLLPLAARVPVTGGGIVWEEEAGGEPVPRLYLSEAEGSLAVQLRFGYGASEAAYDKALPETMLLRKPDTLTFLRVARRPEREQAWWDSLASGHGLKRGEQPDYFILRAKTEPVDFLLTQVPRLTEAGFEIYGERELTSARVNRSRPTVSFSVSSGIDWFDVDGVVHFGDTQVKLKEVRKAARRKERYVKLADGSIGEIPAEWLEKYRYLFSMSEDSGEGLRLASAQVTLLDQLLMEGDRIQADDEFQRRRENLRRFSEIVPRALPDGLKANLHPYQKSGFDWLHFLHEYGFGGCLADDMGLGKAQPLDAKVLTPTGWKRMGDVHVGDWVVGSQGTPCQVTGVFPQGEKEVFRVTFSDGAATECCDDHLWAVNSAVRKRRGNPPLVLPLSVIRQRLRDAAGNCRYFIPTVKPIDFAERALPLHPYLLGALLGDGGIAHRVTFSSGDAEMIERVKALLPATTHMVYKGRYDWQISRDVGGERVNAVQGALRELGLAGHRAEGKFIPDVYKFSSVEARIALLQGLLDTDGYVDSVGKNIEYTSVSPRLAQDVAFLVQSLGGTATLRSKKTTGQLCYRLNIVLPPHVPPFALSRKVDACPARVKYHPTRAIVSVEAAGVKPCQCIAVDAPDHLYVTDDCIVTHNTVQCLAFLQSLSESHEAKAATLLVLPRSLVFNWEREAARFTPTLRLLNHAGTTRAKDLADFDEYDVVLTTYGIMLRDIEMLRKHRFHYVVLDEAQAIKNPVSQSAKAARLLQADHKLTLTGTPVENSTLELWSQFSFLNPGLLGNLEHFRTEFAGAIEKRQDEMAAAFLRRLVHPFILRRTKDQVAKDLPPRTERILYTEMEAGQKKLYEKTRDFYRAQIMGIVDKEGVGDARMKILEGLLRLRQISNHPRLVEPDSKAASGKFETLLETLDTLRAEGHKALVFSQFVQMLSLVRESLDAAHVPYAYLDGKTTDRQGRVDAFQNDPDLPLFLISLKAGGVGLNLTAADYVIHIDPWWNPAVEMQATDRTHRIGQDKPVFVYKLITRETVEEKILLLQDRKRALVSQLISTEGGFFKNLTRQDIELLFE